MVQKRFIAFISMSDSKKIYFASDLHLGAPDYKSSRNREKTFTDWLESIQLDASELYLLGDVFDFWFEYKYVVPKGYIRLLGKLAELSDSGIKISIFQGNHDLWMKDYFFKEFNAEIISHPIIRRFNDKIFYLAHGDGLGPGDNTYKMINRIFRGKINQKLFRWLHPDLGARLANFFSASSRLSHSENDFEFKNEDEALVKHSRQILENQHIDYFVYGHRHIPVEYSLSEKSKIIVLGDMFKNYSFAEFDDNTLELKYFNAFN